MSVATAKLNLSKEMRNEMYPDNELTTCEMCGKLGMTAPDLWGKETFFHKIPSPRMANAFTFTEIHQFI
jgi:hypothetical protein